jgi:hypothetical protein
VDGRYWPMVSPIPGAGQHVGRPSTELPFLWKRGNDHVAQIATSMVDNANCHVSLYLRRRPSAARAPRQDRSAMEYANRGIRVNAVVPGNHQDADASRRPTSWAPCIRLSA